MLQAVLRQCVEWQQNAHSLLDDTGCLLNNVVICSGTSSSLVSKIKHQVLSLECIIQAGLSLRIDFAVTSKLQDACSTLQWSFEALSFCDVIPTLEVGGNFKC